MMEGCNAVLHPASLPEAAGHGAAHTATTAGLQPATTSGKGGSRYQARHARGHRPGVLLLQASRTSAITSMRRAGAGSPRRAPIPSAAEVPAAACAAQALPRRHPRRQRGVEQVWGRGQLAGGAPVRPTGPHGSELGSKTVAEKDGDSRCDPTTAALEFGMGGERARSRFRICPRLWRRWSGLGDRPPAAESCGHELGRVR
jgi:hypothetical protein